MTKLIEARHKSEHERYRRCGLVFGKRWAEYEVDEESLERLDTDPWVELREPGESVEGDSGSAPEDELPQQAEGFPEGWTYTQNGSWRKFVDPADAEIYSVNGGADLGEAKARLLERYPHLAEKLGAAE